jgi:hypothetical protein
LTVDDYFYALTSEGEVIVYRGTDPSDATKFSIVGNYRVGRPIGQRCVERMGEENVIISADGFTTLQEMLNNDVVAERRTISEKIRNAVTNAVSAYKQYDHWEIILSPIGNKLFIHVPTESNGTGFQFVMNTVTKSWCVWDNLGTNTYCYFNDWLYGAIGNSIYRLDYPDLGDRGGPLSAGEDITATCQTAFQYFGGAGMKRFQMARVISSSAVDFRPSFNVNVDLQIYDVAGTGTYSPILGYGWDDASAVWDTAVWGGAQRLSKNWKVVNGLGYCASLYINAKTAGQSSSMYGWEISFDKGGML